MQSASRLNGIALSLIRQINALATPLSLNLGIGEPNIEPDAHLRELARRAANEGSWHYTANAGAMGLRKRLVEGTQLDPKSEVCVTAGTQEGLYAIFQAFVNPGDEVLVPNPGFLSYETIAKICGASVGTYELELPSWRLDAAAVIAKMNERTKIVVVNSPSNPLGAVADRAELQKIAKAADERDILVVSDEVYIELWYEAAPASMLGMGRNVMVVGGMSKSHSMTGLRMGWIFAREELMAPVVTAHQYIATCASTFSQSLAELILADREWNAQWLAGVRAQLAEQREAALHAIRRELEAEIVPPAGAFYAFVPVPACETVGFAKTLATDAAVLVIPGVAFGPAGEGFVRISFAAPVEKIGAGIERIGRYLRSQNR